MEATSGVWEDTRGISPAIGVIILIGIAVVLAVVVGVFVMGVSQTVNESAPSTDIVFKYEANTGNVVIVHGGGAVISPSNTGRLKVKLQGHVSGTTNGSEWAQSALVQVSGSPNVARVTGTISAGDVIWQSSQGAAAGEIRPGDTIRVVWVSDSGETTYVLATFTA